MAADTKTEKPAEQPEKKTTALGEDDEFEDFPVDGKPPAQSLQAETSSDPLDWPSEQTEAAQGETKHLWEESWDDDDTTDDFSSQLKYEITADTQSLLTVQGGA